MVTKLVLAIAFVLGLGLSATAAPLRHTVSGIVKDSGQPVAGASVTLTGSELRACRSSDRRCRNPPKPIATPLRTTTSADGSFAFQNLPSGGYTLEIVAAGFHKKKRFLSVFRSLDPTVELKRK